MALDPVVEQLIDTLNEQGLRSFEQMSVAEVREVIESFSELQRRKRILLVSSTRSTPDRMVIRPCVCTFRSPMRPCRLWCISTAADGLRAASTLPSSLVARWPRTPGSSWPP